MPTVSSYVFIASMDVDSDKEALFNEVYDQEHIPNLLKVAGVRSIYSAIYEIDGPHVLTSEAWAKAVEAGR